MAKYKDYIDEYIDKGRMIVLLARYASKLPDVDILDKKIYENEDGQISTKPLLQRLIEKGAIKKSVADDLGQLIDNTQFVRPTLFVDIGKRYYSRKGYSDSRKGDLYRLMDESLAEQRALRERGRAPQIGELLKAKGIPGKDIETMALLQWNDFIQNNPELLVEVQKRYGGRSISASLQEKNIISKNPVKNMVMAGILGAAFAFGGAMYWLSRPSLPEFNYENMPKYYSNILYAIQYKEPDNSLEGAKNQIEYTYRCIEQVRMKGDEKQKKDAEEIKRKVDLLKQNLDKAKSLDPNSLMVMQLSDIEKKLIENK